MCAASAWSPASSWSQTSRQSGLLTPRRARPDACGWRRLRMASSSDRFRATCWRCRRLSVSASERSTASWTCWAAPSSGSRRSCVARCNPQRGHRVIRTLLRKTHASPERIPSVLRKTNLILSHAGIASVEVDAAVDVEHFAGHIACLDGCEEERRAGNIFWYPASAHRRRGAHGAIELGLLISVERFGRDAGEDEPRRNRIAGDAIRTQLTGRSLAKPNHTRLAGGVVSSPNDPASLLAGDAGDPDDAAPTASHHFRDNGSEAKKASPKVD